MNLSVAVAHAEPWRRKTLKYVWECPKCGTWYEYDWKPRDYSIGCQECRERGYTLIGVLQRVRVPGYMKGIK